LHGKRNIFIEGIDRSDSFEDEANRFAADFLIPKAMLQDFMRKGDRSHRSIKRFAQQLEIAPGIVVGRLQHEKYLPLNHCNDLKRRLTWTREAA
jgi:Zn-dependent peptidase ImmA (M78 family)